MGGSDMSRLSLTTFGGLRFFLGDNREVRLPTRKTAALVAYLGMHAGRRFSREALSGLFWTDKTDSQARHSLSQALSDIRKTFGEGLVHTDGQAAWMDPKRINIDACELPRLVSERTLSSLERAAALYQGEFLEFAELGQEGFDDSAHRVLMQAYAAQGCAPLALEHYHRLVRLLRQELGVVPDQETVAVFRAIAAQDGAQPLQPRTLTQYVFVLEQLPHPVVVTDTQNRIVGWNHLAEADFGFTKAEICGRSPTLVYAPDRNPSLADSILKQALQSGRWSKRVDMVSKDGQLSHQQRIVAPLYSPEGELIGAFGHGIIPSRRNRTS